MSVNLFRGTTFVVDKNIFNVKLPFGLTVTQICGCAGLTIGKKLVMDHYPDCTRPRPRLYQTCRYMDYFLVNGKYMYHGIIKPQNMLLKYIL